MDSETTYRGTVETGDRGRLLAEQQAALGRVATLVAEGATASELFTAVVEEVVAVLDVPAGWLFRYEPDRSVSVLASLNARGFPVGSRWQLDGPSPSATILETGKPARIDDYSQLGGTIASMARESGFGSAFVVPITVDGVLWGLICVGTTERGPLPADTEARLRDFAELVATAISRAQANDDLRRLVRRQEALTRVATIVAEGVPAAELFAALMYEVAHALEVPAVSLVRYEAEQAALRQVATLVARDAPSTEVFEAVATEVGTLLDTDITVVGRYDGDGAATAIGSSSASPVGVPVGTRSAIGGHNVLTIVAETGKPARVDGYDDASGEAAEIARRYGWRSSTAPIVVEDRLWGVMLVATQRPEPFPAGAEERLAAFTDLVATAVANTQAHDELRRFGDEQAALGRIATLVAAGAAPEQVFTAVVEEASSLLDLERIELVRYDGDTGTVIAASGEHPFPAGSTWSLDNPSVMATVARTRRAARIDDYSGLKGEVARAARDAGFQSAIGAPMTVEISTDPKPIPERSAARLASSPISSRPQSRTPRRDTRSSALLPSRRRCGASRRWWPRGCSPKRSSRS